MLDELIKRYPILERVREDIEAVYGILERCYENGGKLLIAGNGGSAADAEHIVGELMKGFVKRRPVTEEMKEALEKADPVRGKELSEKLRAAFRPLPLWTMSLFPRPLPTMWTGCFPTPSRSTVTESPGTYF